MSAENNNKTTQKRHSVQCFGEPGRRGRLFPQSTLDSGDEVSSSTAVSTWSSGYKPEVSHNPLVRVHSQEEKEWLEREGSCSLGLLLMRRQEGLKLLSLVMFLSVAGARKRKTEWIRCSRDCSKQQSDTEYCILCVRAVRDRGSKNLKNKQREILNRKMLTFRKMRDK